MKNKFVEVLADVGFSAPPPCVFYADDPRGPEYGSFEARQIDNTDLGDCLMLHKRTPGGRLLWRAVFQTPDDVRAWAVDCL